MKTVMRCFFFFVLFFFYLSIQFSMTIPGTDDRSSGKFETDWVNVKLMNFFACFVPVFTCLLKLKPQFVIHSLILPFSQNNNEIFIHKAY